MQLGFPEVDGDFAIDVEFRIFSRFFSTRKAGLEGDSYCGLLVPVDGRKGTLEYSPTDQLPSPNSMRVFFLFCIAGRFIFLSLRG